MHRYIRDIRGPPGGKQWDGKDWERTVNLNRADAHTCVHMHAHMLPPKEHVPCLGLFGCSSQLGRGQVLERSKLRPVVLIWEVSLSLKRH